MSFPRVEGIEKPIVESEQGKLEFFALRERDCKHGAFGEAIPGLKEFG